MDFLIIIILIILNGIFAMSEIAIISARKSSLMKESKEGNKNAKTALSLANQPDKFLSTIQIGITLIGILTGIYSGDTIAKELSNILIKINIPIIYASSISKIIVVALVTYLTLIFGELVPKKIALSNPFKVASFSVNLINVMQVIFFPLIKLLSLSTNLICKILKIEEKEEDFTEEDIKRIILTGTRDGIIEKKEQEYIFNIFKLYVNGWFHNKRRFLFYE